MTIHRRNDSLVDLLSADLVANQGELHLNHIAKAANYSAAKESVIYATAGAGGIIVTLPLAVNNDGKTYAIMKIDAGVGAVTVACQGADTIHGSAACYIVDQYESWIVHSDGVDKWWTLACCTNVCAQPA